jgi:hypothetical protein
MSYRYVVSFFIYMKNVNGAIMRAMEISPLSNRAQ